MATIAVYSLKGGVGKTTLAVNLAWSAAVEASRSTLLWDLDPQAASTFILDPKHKAKEEAQAVFVKDVAPDAAISKSNVEGLDLLGADTSLRGLDRLFHSLGKRRRLERLIEGLDERYDRIILDCPPGLTETSEQAMRAADLIIVPVIPSPLSRRALNDVVKFLDRQGRVHAPILPVLSMVDRRRLLHRDAIGIEPDWPVIPMASAVEQMAVRHMPVGAYAARSPAGLAFSALWAGIEQKLAQPKRAKKRP